MVCRINRRRTDGTVSPPWAKAPTLTGGVDLRDYFAAKAMQGFCVLPPSVRLNAEKCAADSYALADLMLKARQS
jgi:hypothetical protein